MHLLAHSLLPSFSGPCGCSEVLHLALCHGGCLWRQLRKSCLHRQMARWHMPVSLSMDGRTHSRSKKYVTRALAYQLTEVGHLFADRLMIMRLAIQAQWGPSKSFSKDFMLDGIVCPTTPMSLHTSMQMHGCVAMRNNPAVNRDHGVYNKSPICSPSQFC